MTISIDSREVALCCVCWAGNAGEVQWFRGKEREKERERGKCALLFSLTRGLEFQVSNQRRYLAT